jgi:hypothetical protein
VAEGLTLPGVRSGLLLARVAIERGDPAALGLLGGVLHTARDQGLPDAVITAAPQVTGYLVEHAAEPRSDPFIKQLVATALEVRATQPESGTPSECSPSLTPAEQRVLRSLRLSARTGSPVRLATRQVD